jgi:hydroxymethylpyrimidine/phosphomethylpyrimidine kinase
LISKHGDRLAADAMIDAYRARLLPMANLITPNRFEAEALLGRKLSTTESFCEAAADLLDLGPEYVLIKAGVIDGLRQHVLADQQQVVSMGLPDCAGNHGHGAGCSLSATITARLALSDASIPQAERLRNAIKFAIMAVHAAVTLSPPLGNGCHPVEHRALHHGDDSD